YWVVRNTVTPSQLSCRSRSFVRSISHPPPRARLARLWPRDERGFVLTGPDLAEHNIAGSGWTVGLTFWRPARRACSPPGTSATARSSGVASPVGEGLVVVMFVHCSLTEPRQRARPPWR